jgi:hypothetical protein
MRAKPGRAQPCQAVPCRAGLALPSRPQPTRLSPSEPCRPEPSRPGPCRTKPRGPCPAKPSHAMPNQTQPRGPCQVLPHPAQPSPALPREPNRALPSRAMPCLTAHRPAEGPGPDGRPSWPGSGQKERENKIPDDLDLWFRLLVSPFMFLFDQDGELLGEASALFGGPFANECEGIRVKACCKGGLRGERCATRHDLSFDID